MRKSVVFYQNWMRKSGGFYQNWMRKSISLTGFVLLSEFNVRKKRIRKKSGIFAAENRHEENNVNLMWIRL